MTAADPILRANAAYVYAERQGAAPMGLAYGEAAVLPRTPKRWPLWKRVVRDVVALAVLAACGWAGIVALAVGHS